MYSLTAARPSLFVMERSILLTVSISHSASFSVNPPRQPRPLSSRTHSFSLSRLVSL